MVGPTLRPSTVGSASPAQREAYRRAREFIDNAIAEVRPGATSADIVRHFPAAEEFGHGSEEEAFGLQYCHGIGLGSVGGAVDEPLPLVRASCRAPRGHGLCPGDLLPDAGRLVAARQPGTLACDHAVCVAWR